MSRISIDSSFVFVDEHGRLIILTKQLEEAEVHLKNCVVRTEEGGPGLPVGDGSSVVGCLFTSDEDEAARAWKEKLGGVVVDDGNPTEPELAAIQSRYKHPLESTRNNCPGCPFCDPVERKKWVEECRAEAEEGWGEPLF